MELKFRRMAGQQTRHKSSNRTFMELKSATSSQRTWWIWRSNRTFMELKLDKVIKGVEDLEF